MLAALADGSARPAGELARTAGVSPSTASSHLSRLQDSGLVEVERHGRHRYYRITSERVGQIAEMLAQLAPRKPIHSLRGSRIAADLTLARTCYDHLAGELGVALLDSLIRSEVIEIDAGEARVCSGEQPLLDELGIDVSALRRNRRRSLARLCLDWSARRHHLAGALGASLASKIIERGWLQRKKGNRALVVTKPGWEGLQRHFGISASNVAEHVGPRADRRTAQ